MQSSCNLILVVVIFCVQIEMQLFSTEWWPKRGGGRHETLEWTEMARKSPWILKLLVLHHFVYRRAVRYQCGRASEIGSFRVISQCDV